MTDGPFKSMTRDPESSRVNWLDPAADPGEWVACDVCGGGYRTGGWPWCSGKPDQHWR